MDDIERRNFPTLLAQAPTGTGKIDALPMRNRNTFVKQTDL